MTIIIPEISLLPGNMTEVVRESEDEQQQVEVETRHQVQNEGQLATNKTLH